MDNMKETERTEQSNFAVRVRNAKNGNQEVHYFDTKAQAEIFRSSCKPTNYYKPVIYPIALHDQLSG